MVEVPSPAPRPACRRPNQPRPGEASSGTTRTNTDASPPARHAHAGGRRFVPDAGGDAVVAEEAPEAELPPRVGRATGARVPDGADQFMQVAKGRLRRPIQT